MGILIPFTGKEWDWLYETSSLEDLIWNGNEMRWAYARGWTEDGPRIIECNCVHCFGRGSLETKSGQERDVWV